MCLPGSAHRARGRSGWGAVPLAPLSPAFAPHVFYPLSSFFDSLQKRQSVPWAISFCGLDLSIPTSCRRYVLLRVVSATVLPPNGYAQLPDRLSGHYVSESPHAGPVSRRAG